MAWAAGAASLCAALYATSLSGHPGLGDAPETSPASVRWGSCTTRAIPAYVLTATLFTLIVPFGSEAFRVNLFSLVCASLCGRRGPIARAALGAAALGGGGRRPGAWPPVRASGFYSGFAKHDMFSGLLFLVTLHLALAWRGAPSVKRLSPLGAAIALGLGSSWPLELLILRRSDPRAADRAQATVAALLVTASATGLVVLVADLRLRDGARRGEPAAELGGATTSAVWRSWSSDRISPAVATAQPASGCQLRRRGSG